MCFISNRTLFYRSYSGSIAGAILPFLPSLLIDTIVRWLMTMIVTRLPKAPNLVRIYTVLWIKAKLFGGGTWFWRSRLKVKVRKLPFFAISKITFKMLLNLVNITPLHIYIRLLSTLSNCPGRLFSCLHASVNITSALGPYINLKGGPRMEVTWTGFNIPGRNMLTLSKLLLMSSRESSL